MLRASMFELRHGLSSAVVLTGEAGLGKTQLLDMARLLHKQLDRQEVEATDSGPTAGGSIDRELGQISFIFNEVRESCLLGVLVMVTAAGRLMRRGTDGLYCLCVCGIASRTVRVR